MALSGAADVVGLLGDRTSYGVYGDHGGAQQDVQSIQMVMYAGGMRHVVSKTQFRLVDVMPTVAPRHGHPADGSDGRKGIQAAALIPRPA